MDIFLTEDLKELVQASDSTQISIYLPTHKVGEGVKQNRIRLKNLLTKAEEKLLGSDLTKKSIGEILKPAESLLGDRVFWNQQSHGLALFLSQDWFRYYRLPEAFEERIVVADRFHIKPLIPFISKDTHFFLLTLSLDQVCLYQGDRFQLEQVETEAIPDNIDEAIQYDDPERELQFHTQTGSPGGSTQRSAAFHGHGVSSENRKKERIERFLQLVEQGVYKLVGDRAVPLLLAGGEYLLSGYKEINQFKHLVPEPLSGNPSGKTLEELHQQAWIKVEGMILENRGQLASEYLSLRGYGQASENLAEVIPAAHQGRVRDLFVASDQEVWGDFSPDNQTVKIYEEPVKGAEDLLDLAVVMTFLQGGGVYALPEEEIPGEGVIAAIFRY